MCIYATSVAVLPPKAVSQPYGEHVAGATAGYDEATPPTISLPVRVLVLVLVHLGGKATLLRLHLLLRPCTHPHPPL